MSDPELPGSRPDSQEINQTGQINVTVSGLASGATVVGGNQTNTQITNNITNNFNKSSATPPIIITQPSPALQTWISDMHNYIQELYNAPLELPTRCPCAPCRMRSQRWHNKVV